MDWNGLLRNEYVLSSYVVLDARLLSLIIMASENFFKCGILKA